MEHQRSWGPSHNPDLPGGIQLGKTGGYWWAIAGGAVVTIPLLIRTTTGQSAEGQSAWLVIAAMAASAVAVGAGEARRGLRFASGRWVLFTVATAAVLASAWGIPAAAYLLGFYGWPRYAEQRQRSKAAAAAAGRGAKIGNRSATKAFGRNGSDGAQASNLPSLPGGFFGVTDRGQPVTASPRGAALVIGPPGSGKTQGVIMPSVAFAPAACVSTSMKAEVLAATMTARQQRGRCWLFDPGGGPPPAGVISLRWNPLCDVTDWDAARSVAARLTGPSRGAAGASHDGDHWVDRAETWLSVLLFAAKLSQPGGDIAALARWCMSPTATGPEAEAVLIVAQEDDIDGADIAAALLDSMLGVPDKERESIASTLARIMNIYTSSAALRAGVDPNFDAAAFVRSTDTVYVTAPVDRQRDYAPLIAGFLESIRLAQYHRRQAVDLGTETQAAPVTFVLDEAANTAPIPLPNIVSEAGGQGLHLVVAFQDLSQARARWGRAADGFLTLFPEKLILSGMADRDTAEMLSRMSGEYDRMTIGVSTPGRTRNSRGGTSRSEPGYTYSSHRTAVLSVADITGIPPGRGLYWSPRGWELLTINPWWQHRSAYGL
ncbi:type IV secretory system conjugative DNA transfer family protein [Mycolicibacterium fortuitum]|nr:type IV secretory system conjugative DNA transfer family protein [Mycolicibacterium fortuitum]MCV7142903.1 type IV secretory system conjugative DNA transfer family protein [Mycolicibacterium fortuitum]